MPDYTIFKASWFVRTANEKLISGLFLGDLNSVEV